MSNNKMTYSGTITTPVFRCSFPHLFKPFVFPTGRNFDADEKGKYSVVMLFDKETTGINWFREEVGKLIQQHWPEGWPEGARSPVKDGDAEPAQLMPGHWMIDAHSFNRPGVVDRDKSAIIDEERIYGGCYLRATIKLGAYSGLGGGITVYLNNVQFVKDGDRFGNSSTAFDDFDVISDESSPASSPSASVEANQLPF